MKDLTIIEMRYFLKIVECGNISTAAAELFITQPALSRHLMNLENTLQFQLFHRSRSGVTLTDKGQRFYKDCNKVIQAVNELNRQVALLQGKITGQLRIGYSKSNEKYMFKLQKALAEKYRDIEVSLTRQGDKNFIRMLQDEELDAAFAYELECNDYGANLHCIPLGTVPSMVLLSKDNHLSEKRFLTMKDLINEKFIMPPRNIHPAKHNTILSACKNNGYIPNIFAYERQYTNILLQVKTNNAIYITPYVHSIDISDEMTVYIPIVDFPYSYKVCLCYTDENKNPALDKLIDVVNEMRRSTSEF